MADKLGIYFGPKVISIVESKGKKIANHIPISRSILSAGDLEEKVPQEVKLVAVFHDELRKHKIEAKEAAISFSGKDLIVRTFELPLLPPDELSNAVNFEAKKYIPFKVEDLVSDYHVEFNKLTRKNIVLFVGIKKDALDKHLSIFEQLKIKVSNIDYSAFAILRLLKIAGLAKRGIVAVASADLKEEDEINFTVLEEGFPVFSRDITLAPAADDFTQPQAAGATELQEKLKSEIRVSLDYYNRKFPAKKIQKMVFITDKDSQADLDAFIKETGLNAQFLDTAKYIGKAYPFSLSLVKGYACSLFKAVRSGLKINLLAPKAKARAMPKISIFKVEEAIHTVNPKVLVTGILLLAIAAGLSFYRTLPVRKELRDVIALRPVVRSARPDVNYVELMRLNSEYQNKVETLNNLVTKQVLLSEVMEAVARAIPQDLWLTDFYFSRDENKNDLVLRGFIYLSDAQKEYDLVNNFLSRLKENPTFMKYYKNVELVSVEQQQSGKITVTGFNISCKGK